MVQFLSGIVAVLLALFGLQTMRVQAAKNKSGQQKLNDEIQPDLDKIDEQTKQGDKDEENFDKLDNQYTHGHGKPLC